MDQQRFLEALKNLTGSTDLEVGHSIIRDTANILSAESIEEKLNKASAMLSALHPKDETEAMLLGQFLALRDSGMGCLKRAQNQDMINHFEKLLILATKILLEKKWIIPGSDGKSTRAENLPCSKSTTRCYKFDGSRVFADNI